MPELRYRRDELLALLGHGERYVQELADASGRCQSNVSRDLKRLLLQGLVVRRYKGVRAYYRAIPGGGDNA